MRNIFHLSILFLVSFTFTNCSESNKNLHWIEANWEYRIDNQEYKKVENPSSLSVYFPERKGEIWLRSKFRIDTKSYKLLSIGLGKIMWADEVYINGNFVGNTGKFPPQPWNAWNTNRIYPLDKSMFNEEENILLIRMYVESDGMIDKQFVIGERSEVENEFYFNSFLRKDVNLYIALLFTLLSAYHLVIYLKRKKEVPSLYYALFSFTYALYSSNFFSDSLHVLGISYVNYQKFILMVTFISAFTLTKFLTTFFEKENSKGLKRIFIFGMLLPIVLGLVQPNYVWLRKVYSISLFFLFPVIAYIIYLIIWAVKNKRKGAVPILYGFIPTIIFIIHDNILAVFFPLNIKYYLTGLGFPAFISSIMFILASRTAETQNITEDLNAKLEEWNATLEEKVKERTLEVTKKMQEIEELKIQQDGDYFLTSLIEKPLATNYNKSKQVRSEFLIQQKKKFVFRNRQSEIGGDICITGNLRFFTEKNRYIMFFNGDAMGKSMQGAGGAIVLGTSLNNIMRRSAKDNRILKISPEKWIENTYYELNAMFSTFNGSMMISGVLGLINEFTGEMYYFNAEHPWTVLYRDGKADFIETELSLRKLGSESEFSFAVKKFQLQAGDILIAASDGRDDLDIGIEHKEINEDESLFLSIVEEAKTDLNEIVRHLKSKGKLTDDLSILKIEYKENDSEPLSQEFLWMKILDYMKNKNYGDAIYYLEKYLSLDKKNSLAFFYLSVCIKVYDQYEKAIEYGKIAYELDEYLFKNLINLSDAYRLKGYIEEARFFYEKARNLDPTHIQVIKLSKFF
ncbi:MAG: SpoIIE family protein phosphatase [Leptospiraceae bacterium]|nr:SpoIIE family protein phosphatase [Leptospiraceae bacterium]MCP5500688.1 SpoIIE family protein phosphatase [Leptospiraceae bacterium]